MAGGDRSIQVRAISSLREVELRDRLVTIQIQRFCKRSKREQKRMTGANRCCVDVEPSGVWQIAQMRGGNNHETRGQSIYRMRGAALGEK